MAERSDRASVALDSLGCKLNQSIGHFDIYIGDNFEKAVSDQLEFFEKHL